VITGGYGARVTELLSGIQLAIRASTAATASLLVAGALELDYPIYAFIAAVIVTDLQPPQTRQLGLRRIVSTVIGAATGAVLSPLLPAGTLAIGAAIFLAMLLCALLRVKDGSRVAGYICGIVLLDHSAEPWSYAFFRLVETLIGVGIAWLIACVPLLIRTERVGE
jgi:uncharacterized membrane protein YgaE (UPF0421/DUF939 family)